MRDNDDVMTLAKIIDSNAHDYLETHNVKWPDPSYIFWNEKREQSINLALRIIKAGYQKNSP
jgi:hypothetical protein